MSSRLAMKRLSLSDSSRTVATRSILALSSSCRRQILERPRGADDRGKRGLQIVGNGGEKGGAQAIRFLPALGPVQIVDEVDTLNGKSRLIDEGIKQAALVGGEQRSGLVAVDADDADGAAAGAHGQEKALGAGQRIRAAPRRPIVLPSPFRRGEIGFVENVLRRITGPDGDRAVLGQQQHDADLQHQRRLVCRRPKQIVEGADAGELAAEHVKRLGGARPGHGRDRESTGTRRDIGNDDRHDGEENNGNDIPRVGDREGVVRLGEEEIVAERRRHAGEERRPQAEANGDGDDRRQEHEVGVLHADPRPEQLADADSGADAQQREDVRLGVEGLGPFGGANGLFRQRLAGDLLAGDDVKADIAASAREIAHHRAVEQLEPSRARGFPDDHLRDVVGLRKGDHVVGDPAIAAWNGDLLAAERLSEPQACRRPGHAPPRSIAGCVWSRHRAPSKARAGGRRGAWCSARARPRAGPR